MQYRTSARLSGYFEKAKENHAALVAFLHKMPKGGDLHNHPTGAVNTETIVRLAAEKGMYFDRERRFFTREKPAGPFYAPEELAENYWKHGEIIEGLSLRNRELAGESGHDRFFRSFDRFDIVLLNDNSIYAEIMRRALNQEIGYLELMALPTDEPDWRDIVENARLGVIKEFADKGMERDLEVRFIYPLVRTSIFAQPEAMRKQMAKALETAAAMPDLFKGITILAPEDDPQSQKYFREHMQIIAEGMREARQRHEDDPANNPPPPRLMLHAGELTIEYATYESMTTRISSVLGVDGIARLGHATCLMWDDNFYEVLRDLRDRRIAVEFCPTSAESILKVAGRQHFFPVLWAANAPVVIGTDDEGVARSNMTLEYAKAAEWYDLSYPELKWLAFNSIEYSFLPGDSYFVDGDFNAPRPDAEAVADVSEKARVQRALLRRFAAFEQKMEDVLDMFGW